MDERVMIVKPEYGACLEISAEAWKSHRAELTKDGWRVAGEEADAGEKDHDESARRKRAGK